MSTLVIGALEELENKAAADQIARIRTLLMGARKALFFDPSRA